MSASDLSHFKSPQPTTTAIDLSKTKLYALIFFCLAGFLKISAQINADQVLRIGQNALYFEDYMLSIQYFNQVISAKPYLAQPYFFRSIAKINLEDYRGAEADASLALERNPFITDAWEVRGVARQNMGDNAGAIADYNEALKLLPNNRSILFNKALAQEEVKDYEGAAETFSLLARHYPQFDGTYMGRARLYMLTGDTIAAKADLDKAISLNKNATNAYLMRADIAMHSNPPDYEAALEDMDEAVKLQPRYAGFFINRAYLRYMRDDYFGAMADYDYAIALDPLNETAYFNRGLLRAEVRDNDKAIGDFSKVVELNSENNMARYNRAMLYTETRQWDKALDDINHVIEAYPDFAPLYYARFEINRDRGGHLREAERDYYKAEELTKKEVARVKQQKKEGLEPGVQQAPESEEQVKEASEKLVADRFKSLLTIENEANLTGEYNNKSIRGKVQDRNINVEIEPIFVLSYYDSPNELKETGYYMKDVDDINTTRILRFMLQVTNRVPALEDERVVNTHFSSIDYYNSYLSTHEPRSVDYFGRGMDFMTTRNYTAAIADFTRAIDLTPDWSLPYFMRGIALYYELKTPVKNLDETSGNEFEMRRGKLKEMMSNFEKVEELAPTSPFAFYNKGTILLENGDLTSAISALTQAIELKPDFGEAYFNRGYAYMQLGNRQAGAADLSKAGELGILPSYNLLKRMNQ